MRLPEQFVQRMERLLGQEEYQDFLGSFNLPRYYGLRVNTLKISVAEFLKQSPFELEPVPWTQDGFYYREGARPAKHPYYFAGLYYIQEPSAMAPAALLDIQPGDRVLDLCAAPGGKSTQAAARLGGQGLLVSNDISAERLKPLSKNLELFGVTNGVILNETPDRLRQRFLDFFDKILIDAPCSGEGMFRKDEEAARSWGVHSVEVCVGRQRDILQQVADMLKPGGMILYSTCTFAPEENEGSIGKFLADYPDFELVEIPKAHGFAPGRPEWLQQVGWTQWTNPELTKTTRLWPHKVRGEGHYLALLRKRPEAAKQMVSPGNGKPTKGKKMVVPKVDPRQLQDFFAFVENNLQLPLVGPFTLYGDHLYQNPQDLPDLAGLKVMRPGWYLGMLKTKRFEPSHALAMSLKPEQVKRCVNLPTDSPLVVKYLKGESLELDGERGWTLVTVEGYPLGWGKQVDGILKNYYPKGWRWVD